MRCADGGRERRAERRSHLPEGESLPVAGHRDLIDHDLIYGKCFPSCPTL